MRKLTIAILFAALALTPALSQSAATGPNLAPVECGVAVTTSSTSTARDYDPRGAIDGDRKGLNWERGGGWNDATRDAFPDWIQLTLPCEQAVNRVVVAHLQNNFAAPVEPTTDTPATFYQLVDYDVQAWDGRNWQTVRQVRGNNRALNDLSFPAVTTRAVRLYVLAANGLYSRVVELETHFVPVV
jgi:hypothetical protein